MLQQAARDTILISPQIVRFTIHRPPQIYPRHHSLTSAAKMHFDDRRRLKCVSRHADDAADYSVPTPTYKGCYLISTSPLRFCLSTIFKDKTRFFSHAALPEFATPSNHYSDEHIGRHPVDDRQPYLSAAASYYALARQLQTFSGTGGIFDGRIQSCTMISLRRFQRGWPPGWLLVMLRFHAICSMHPRRLRLRRLYHRKELAGQ